MRKYFDKLNEDKEDPVQLTPELQADYDEFADPVDDMFGALKTMHVLELKYRAYDYIGNPDSMVKFYKEETGKELDAVASEIITRLERTFEDWLNLHSSGEAWAEEILDPYDNHGLYRNPSDAFEGRVVGVLDFGSWHVDTEQEILDEVNKNHAPPPIPSDSKELFKVLEYYLTSEELKELKKEFRKGDIDEDGLAEKLQDFYSEDDNYLVSYEISSGLELADYLDRQGWYSELGKTILKIMETSGYEQWRDNFPDTLDTAEENVKEALDALKSADTINDKMVAINRAIQAEHVFGQMYEKVDLSKSELDYLSEMGDKLKDFKDMIKFRYRVGESKTNESSIDFPRYTLSPAVWNKKGEQYSLKPEAKAKILDLLKQYPELNLVGMAEEIRIPGSLASNTYRDDVDVDVHIVPKKDFAAKYKTPEQQKALQDTVMKWYSENLEKIDGHIGKHPIEVYVQFNPAQDLMSDGCYSLTQDKWLKEPTVRDIKYNPYDDFKGLADEIRNDVKDADLAFGELRRDVVDFDTFKQALKQLKPEDRDHIVKMMSDKLKEIEQDIDRLYKDKKEWTSARRDASKPATEEEAFKDVAMASKWKDTNAAFKFIARYRYLKTINALHDLVKDDSKITPNEIEVMKKIIGSNESINEGVAELEKKYVESGQIDKEQFDKFVKGDPSKTKKYVGWMAARYAEKQERPEHLIDAIKVFDKYVNKNLIQNKDINSYKTVEQLDDAMDEIGDTQTKSQKVKEIKSKGAEKVIDNDKCYVYHITTHEAAMLYGKGTKWCITMPNGYYWQQYTERNYVTFYFAILKKDVDIPVGHIGRLNMGDDSKRIKEYEMYPAGSKFAIAIYPDHQAIEVYDAQDDNMRYYEYVLQTLDIDIDDLDSVNYEDMYNAHYDEWYESTIENVKDELEKVLDDESYSDHIFDPDKLDNDKDSIAGDIFNYMAQNDMHGEFNLNVAGGEDNWESGSYVDKDEIMDALIALELADWDYIEGDEEKKQAWKDQRARRDLKGQMKFNFSESIRKLMESIIRGSR